MTTAPGQQRSLAPAFDIDVKISSAAPPPAYQHSSSEVDESVCAKLCALLGSRATQAILADAVLTVVFSLYSSIHHLLSLVSASHVSLACAYLPTPSSATEPLPAHLIALCSEANASAARDTLILGSPWARWLLLAVVVLKAAGGCYYLRDSRKGSWALTSRSSKACDLVVTSIACHALLGFCSFLVLPLLPQPAALVNGSSACLAGAGLVLVGLGVAVSLIKGPRNDRRLTLV